MSTTPFDIFELPQDILDIIFLELQPREFLSFCSVSKVFWHTQYLNHTYWRTKTSKTFRIPISPLLHAQGDRWFWLYRKLLTETQAFSWGQGSDGALGLPPITASPPGSQSSPANLRSGFMPALGSLILGRPSRRPNQESTDSVGAHLHFDRSDRAWPSKMYVPGNVGIIADLQCGGWSTTLLSSKGALFSVGIFSARDGRQIGKASKQLKQLESNSSVPIKSFSAGREHVLGLDEDNLVWSRDRLDRKSVCIRLEDGVEYGMRASKVVAGWSVSSALTNEGILYWQVVQPVRTIESQEPANEPSPGVSLWIVRATLVSGTAPKSQRAESSDERYELLSGEVVTYIVLENFIVFLTDRSKVFASKIHGLAKREGESFEVTSYSAPGRQLKDIQGSFRNFSVFTADGKVLRGTQEYLDQLYNLRVQVDNEGDQNDILTAVADILETQPDRPSPGIVSLKDEANDINRPLDIPALQDTGVISIAYGDYHLHALHSNGTITTYGQQPRSRGAFGLSKLNSGALFRGIKIHGPRQWGVDSRLQPIAWRHGRVMWFSQSQSEWLQHLEDSLRMRDGEPLQHPTLEILLDDDDKQATYSEWIEREGRAWEDGATGEDGLPSYFAISVAAAGWHSGALVLENQKSVEMVDRKWRQKDGDGEYVWKDEVFPRIRFPNGYEIPGPGGFQEWKGGMPLQEELINTVGNVGMTYGSE